MPKNAKGRNKRSRTQNTPRVRPLEALLRRGDNRAYQEACSIITLEGPMLHPPGSVFPHGRWDPNGEWTEENFRITQETIKTIMNQIGVLTQEDAQAILDTAINWDRDLALHARGARKPEVQPESPPTPPVEVPAPTPLRVRPGPAQQLPEVEQHRAGTENLNARLRAARSLLAIPEMDPWLQAESVGLQIGHALEALEDIWRRMHPRAADSARGTGNLPEFARRTSAITSGNSPRDAETVQVYLDEAASWLTNGVEGLLDHTAPLSSGQRLWAHMTGPGGEAACGMLPAMPDGAMTCTWPECLTQDPRKCRHSQAVWQECNLPDGSPTQTRDKYFMDKHARMFPWPPEWDAEVEMLLQETQAD